MTEEEKETQEATKRETKRVLEEAKREIEGLRYHNNIMGAKLEMFDNCMMLLKARPQEMGYAHKPDVVGDINSLLEGM